MSETASIDEFLAASLRAVRKGSAAPYMEGANASWEDIWKRIEYHGIAFLLNNEAELLIDWPRALQERIAEEARLIALWETTHRQTLCQVLDALSAADIDAVIMKGTALAYSLHTQPEIRRRGDTDLLVRPKDQKQTRALLQKLGWYRKDDTHGIYFQEGWLHDTAGFFVHAIDLHWEPSDRPALQDLLSIDAFFSNRQPLPDLHKAAFRPDIALMIIHATINQKWHSLLGYHAESGRVINERRLIWSLDMELMCQSMNADDWARLEALCKTHGVGALIAEALHGMQHDLGKTLPEERIKALEAIPLNDTLVTYFAKLDSLSQFWIDLKKTKSLQQKAKLFVMRAFPPRDHLLEKYPAADKWPTLLLQCRMLIETALRAFRKVATR